MTLPLLKMPAGLSLLRFLKSGGLSSLNCRTEELPAINFMCSPPEHKAGPDYTEDQPQLRVTAPTRV